MQRFLTSVGLAAASVTAVIGVAGGLGDPRVPPPPAAMTGTLAPVHARPVAPTTVGAPTRFSIPAIGVDERLHAVGLQADGAMQTPDWGEAGWYDRGPRPGAAGAAVLVAHVHGPDGPDVFWDLHELAPGDRVTVERTDGETTFVVTGVEQTPKDDLPHERIWPDTDEPVLRLLTCGGEYDPAIGGYPDNTIVYAHRLPSPTPGHAGERRGHLAR